MKLNDRPYVMTIGGLDPSGGAGILADVKCFEQLGVYGFGVCSALTIQTDDHFLKLDWLTAHQIIDQAMPLLEKFPVFVCKVGLIKDIDTLLEVAEYLKRTMQIQIILDPVLKASAGFDFHNWSSASVLLRDVLPLLALITPNAIEMEKMESAEDAKEAAKELSSKCPVLLKGGHAKVNRGTDYLFINEEVFELAPKVNEVFPKHGSGCVLSAAIAAYLAQGATLLEACRLSKTYIERFLNSNHTLLGYHNNEYETH